MFTVFFSSQGDKLLYTVSMRCADHRNAVCYLKYIRQYLQYATVTAVCDNICSMRQYLHYATVYLVFDSRFMYSIRQYLQYLAVYTVCDSFNTVYTVFLFDSIYSIRRYLQYSTVSIVSKSSTIMHSMNSSVSHY